MAYSIQITIAKDQTFRSKVLLAMIRVAITVSAEASDVVNTGNRKTFAKALLNNPEGHLDRVALAVVADDATLHTASDAAVETRVAAVWNALSGVL